MNAKHLKLFPLLLAVLMLSACGGGGGGDGGGGGASPSAGSLDTSFGGGDGIVTTPIGTTASASALAIQPLDGKIVVAGSDDGNSFVLARYTSTGVLDTTFGPSASGIVTTLIGTSAGAHALALQPDGKILVAGLAIVGGIANFALARYTSSGALDGSFGTGGIVTTPIGTSASASALAIQPLDGEIVVAGFATISGTDNFALARYTASGALDGSFGTGGIVTTAVGTDGDDQASALALQPDGKIVVAGFTIVGGLSFALARYTSSGALDGTFGTDGIITTPIGTSASASALALQPDGKIVAAGFAIVGGIANLALARYTSSGALDGTFGTDGIVTTPIGTGASASALAIQPLDGKIVVAGSGDSNLRAASFALARYTSSGTLDGSFGTGGIVTTLIGTSAQASALALQPDGKIVAAGDASVGAIQFALARYNSE